MRALSRVEVREVDRRAIEVYGMSGLVLMENAGRGCVDILLSLGCRGPVAVVCGKGNNAGDGFVIARHLLVQGIAVKLVKLCEPDELSGDVQTNSRIASKFCEPDVTCGFLDLPTVDQQRPRLTIAAFGARFSADQLSDDLVDAEWIVDAILGTGAVGPPRPPFGDAIRVINSLSARKLAVDLPSGLDCDTGIPAEPTFRAEHTCTFVAPKLGFAYPLAAPFLGQVHVVGIGVPLRVVEEVTA